jgi:hypothetical protein
VAIKYQPIKGSSAYEMVDVTIDGSGSSSALCMPAKELATDAASHLPH